MAWTEVMRKPFRRKKKTNLFDLPSDIIINILLKLPLEHFIAFALFVTMQTRLRISTNAAGEVPRLMLVSKISSERVLDYIHMQSLKYDGQDMTAETKINAIALKNLPYWPWRNRRYDSQKYSLEFCYHGLFSYKKESEGQSRLLLCDPLRGEILKLLTIDFLVQSKNVGCSYGMGFDSKTNTHKIVCVSSDIEGCKETQVLVLLGTDSWKKILSQPPCHIKDDLKEKDEKAENDKVETCDMQIEKKRRRSCSTVKCGCEANMRVLHDKWTSRWKVSVFSDIHNHKIVSPTRRMMMKSNKHMPDAAKDLTEAFQRQNLRISKVPSMFGDARNIGFDNRDCYNYLRNVRHKELEYGDAQSVLNYFRKKQAENPQFFYAIQCDEDGRATNFFWVDSRSRTAYQYFGDVVTFDTTYRTNKYDMPFVPFTRVNHHFQSIQFGCALLQDETESTFLWLFETWLEAMGGRHPLCIIIDQDLAMKGAIAKIFPTARHRLCIWHIMKKFGEKLSHVYYKKSNFKTGMKKCIWATYRQRYPTMPSKVVEFNSLANGSDLQSLLQTKTDSGSIKVFEERLRLMPAP
ncbi:hypothetical protein ACLB2K_060678 [Fragaria x ananassa]